MNHPRHASTITALLSLLVPALFQPPAMATVMERLVLSELFYDRQGTDNGFEWAELFNASATPIDLGDWSLGYGGRDYTAGTLQLSGTIRSGAYFVVGGPSSDASNGSPVFDQRVDFTPDIQNAGAVADGVALFHTRASAVGPHSIPIDALIYGRRNGNGLLDELGRAGQVDAGDAPSGQDLTRSTFTQWRIAASATPGRGPLSLALVHEPMSATLLLAGLLALGLCRARSQHVGERGLPDPCYLAAPKDALLRNVAGDRDAGMVRKCAVPGASASGTLRVSNLAPGKMVPACR